MRRGNKKSLVPEMLQKFNDLAEQYPYIVVCLASNIDTEVHEKLRLRLEKMGCQLARFKKVAEAINKL